MPVHADLGSIRDARGQIYISDARVYRSVMPTAVADYEFVRDSGYFNELISESALVGFAEVDPEILGPVAPDARYVLEHPKLPFISYPYEWSFRALKAAALLQLDVYLKALDHGITLSDATAYNVQFQGARPIFIDHLSFRRYRDGEYWLAHRQFCEQFLNPLLLRAKLGIPHNAWYRGSLEGISAQELSALLPMRKKLSWNVFTQVVLQASFQKTALNKDARAAVPSQSSLPRAAYQRMIASLRDWIAGLSTPRSEKTVWAEYTAETSYKAEDTRRKQEFIARFAADIKPAMLWDIGCNTGEFAKTALHAGADCVIGFDFDQLALDRAFDRARAENLNFLPLFHDIANPAPDQGWAESERKGLFARATADAVVALAIVHHLAITRNIPLANVVDWLVSLAPDGVVEFVPKSDPMVQDLLRLREDVFDDYNEQHFINSLERRAKIVDTEVVSESGRKLVRYRRHS